MKTILSTLLLLGSLLLLSCSTKNEPINKEEYPVFEEPKRAPSQESEPAAAIENDIIPTNREHFHVVEIKQMKFQPDELYLAKGDTVLWINKDFVLHDVTEEANKRWSSDPLPSGKSWSKVITESTDYFCSLHVVMKGKLFVE